MSDKSFLFEEFPAQSLEEWQAKVLKDLRGKPMSDLEWSIEDNIKLNAFYHPESAINGVKIDWSAKENNDWEIGEYLEVEDAKSANEAALEALRGGAQALVFRFKKSKPEEELEILLKDIELPFISTHFEQFHVEKQPYELLLNFFKFIEQKEFDPKLIRGSIDFDPLLDWVTPPIAILEEAIQFCEKHLYNFKTLQINGRTYHAGSEYTSREMAMTIGKASEYLAILTERGLSPEVVNRHMQFTLSTGTSYFVEIAKLRAFRILWGNIMKAYGLDPANMPLIETHLALETQVEDQNTNMIHATTQAMSAVIGGADRIYVLPANTFKREPGTSFTRRIARNVQHLLKMESYMDRVIDPAAGSYYIEKLTENLAEEAWKKFQEFEQQGEFRWEENK